MDFTVGQRVRDKWTRAVLTVKGVSPATDNPCVKKSGQGRMLTFEGHDGFLYESDVEPEETPHA